MCSISFLYVIPPAGQTLSKLNSYVIVYYYLKIMFHTVKASETDMAKETLKVSMAGEDFSHKCGLVKVIAIVDECFYNRLAIETFISCFNKESEIYSFSCFTDYKSWDGFRTDDRESCYVIINTSSGSLYGDDVVSFLRYERLRSDVSGVRRPILFLSNNQGYLTCQNAILNHYLIQMQKSSLLTVVDCDSHLPSKKMLVQLFNFIKQGAPYSIRNVANPLREYLDAGCNKTAGIMSGSRNFSY